MPLPLVGALIGGAAKRLLPSAARLAGRGLRFLTKGKLLGQGGGREIARTVARGGAAAATTALTVATVRDVVRSSRGTTANASIDMSAPYGGPGYRARRMNPLNPRALNRAIRRLGGAEKMFKKVFSFNHGTAATRVRPKIKRGR